MNPSERDQIGELIARAGERHAPPAETRQSVWTAVQQQWTGVVARRRLRSTRRWLIAAAVVTAAVGTLLYVGVYMGVKRAPNSNEIAATFIASQGSVAIHGSGSGTPVVSGDDIRVGTRLKTGSDGRALLAAAGISIRVGGASDVTFEQVDLLRVTRGRVYIDGGMQAEHSHWVDVQTPLGIIRHVGTQFEVNVAPDQVTVRVRDGLVSMTSGNATTTLSASDQLVVAASGELQRSSVPVYGELWAWTNDLSPDFPIEGRTFDEFLRWFAHETGRRLEFDSTATEAAARATQLSGNISGLKPVEALRAVEATTRFSCDLSDPSRLRVSASHASAEAVPTVDPDVKLRSDADASRSTAGNLRL